MTLLECAGIQADSLLHPTRGLRRPRQPSGYVLLRRRALSIARDCCVMRKLLLVLGAPIDDLTIDEALARCDEFVATGRATGRTHQIAMVSADLIVESLHDPELRRILQEADLAPAEGAALVWSAQLLGKPLSGRISGGALVLAIAARAAERGYSIYLLGQQADMAEQAGELLQRRCPGLKLAGVCAPLPGSVVEMDRSVFEQVAAAKPDILLVALGSPRQEKWIRTYAAELQVPIAIGVGRALEMLIGGAGRAPAWMRRRRLGWLYGLISGVRRQLQQLAQDLNYLGYFFTRQWWAMSGAPLLSLAPAGAPGSATPPIALASHHTPEPPASPALSAPEPRMSVIQLRGRLDVTNYTGFVEQARRATEHSPNLIVDLSAAEFLDSTALGALVALANQLRVAGGALYLVALSKPVAELLALVRLDRFFEILPDAEAAERRRATPEAPAAPRKDADGWAVTRAPRIFDAGTAPLLLDHCEGSLAAAPRLVLDLTETVFLSSAGMAALIRLDRLTREHGGELRIAGCAPDILRTLQLVRFDAILKIYGTTDEARAALGASAAPDTAGPLLPA